MIAGYSSQILALAVNGSKLYAGGDFMSAGGVNANSIIEWDGTAWRTLGIGVTGMVYAITILGNDVYVGGSFPKAGGISVNFVAKWDGIAWSSLGTGVNGYVYAFTTCGTNLYVGGAFTTAGGTSANHIARWDGTSWSPVGSGVNNSVYALTSHGSHVYAGGYFSTAGGLSANRIAEWDGTNCWALGSGLDNIPLCMAVGEAGRLFVGGRFYTAGSKISPFITQANLEQSPGHILRIAYNPGLVVLECQASAGFAYALERASDVLFRTDVSTLMITNPPEPDGVFQVSDRLPLAPHGFYRLNLFPASSPH